MKRDTVIATRCNETERKALAALAKVERRSPSETIRELVRAAAIERGVWPADRKAA